MTVVVSSAVTGQDSSRALRASTPKYHAAEKHDTLHTFNHIKQQAD